MMNRALFVLLAICALTAAMVPRHRRAINQDEKQKPSEKPSEKSSEKPFCASTTPCAWTIYKPKIKIVEQYITNSYCVCAPGMTCQESEDDVSANAFIFHCRKNTEAPKS